MKKKIKQYSPFPFISLFLSLTAILLFILLLSGNRTLFFSETEFATLRVFWIIFAIIAIIFPFISKYNRNFNHKKGATIEVIAFIIALISFLFLFDYVYGIVIDKKYGVDSQYFGHYIDFESRSFLSKALEKILYLATPIVLCILYAKVFKRETFKNNNSSVEIVDIPSEPVISDLSDNLTGSDNSSVLEKNKKLNISNVVLSKGAYMKEKLQGVLGIFGIILYYLFTALLTVAPLISLGLPWWVDLIILLVVQLFPPIDIAFYIWALIVTVQEPQDWWAIVFYVCFGLFILFTIVPFILKLFKPRKKVKEKAEQIQIDVESEEPADEHDEELPVPEKGYMFCRKCGAKIPGDSDFCPKCGKSTKYKVKKESSIKKIIISSLLLIFILALGTFLVFAFTREKSYCIGSFDLSEIPEFKGKPFVVLNNNKPYFNTKTVPDEPYEHYSPLDNRGRSGVCEAFICKEIMPSVILNTIAEDIGDNYVRAYQLIPERFNRETFGNEYVVFFATDYLVYSGKKVFEDQIYEYVTSTGNGVFYRVTPVYLADRNNICSGVILEAYSPTDNGNGVCFNVYCYNVQPGEDFSYQQTEKVDSYRLKKRYSTK